MHSEKNIKQNKIKSIIVKYKIKHKEEEHGAKYWYY